LGLIRFSPTTGRTHQIRVHASGLGCPIVGDDQYGDRKQNRTVREETGLDHQALHAWKLAIPNQKGLGKIRATAFLPEALTAVLDYYVEGWKEAVKKGK
ncbi:MAG: RluA family pseudouridine synthase, partial [Planctomycetota bacterium]